MDPLQEPAGYPASQHRPELEAQSSKAHVRAFVEDEDQGGFIAVVRDTKCCLFYLGKTKVKWS